MAAKIGCPYMDVSAVTGFNVDKSFQKIISEIKKFNKSARIKEAEKILAQYGIKQDPNWCIISPVEEDWDDYVRIQFHSRVDFT